MADKKTGRRIHDEKRYGHFITFSCYRKARLLGHERARGIVIHYLSEQLKNQNGECMGFVVMPNHVHALVRFEETGKLSTFMSQWKRRSSMGLKKLLKEVLIEDGKHVDLESPVWQRRHYSFEVYSKAKAIEKIDYMHWNPVKAGLVDEPEEWRQSSARWFLGGKPVGVLLTKAL
ncbi:MAG: transposase [Desulfatibacillum sp.]|nr:transposase [Desulfatibacillum sp.]